MTKTTDSANVCATLQGLSLHDTKTTPSSVSGIRNPGSLGYVTALAQVLFNIKAFRKAVYKEFLDVDAALDCAIFPQSLQQLFFDMQFGHGTPANLNNLTKSFGWGPEKALQMGDVVETFHQLYGFIEEKTPQLLTTFKRLFESSTLSYIQALYVPDCRSEYLNKNVTLTLDVKGCRDIYASLEKFADVEILDGANKFTFDGHGAQEAKKGQLLDSRSLPDVLVIQLRRFDIDLFSFTVQKVDDHFVYYDSLDLGFNDGLVLEPGADKDQSYGYKLHSVVAHAGTSSGGQYYSYTRSVDEGSWIEAEDEKVRFVAKEEVCEGLWGGQQKGKNAYVLVYVRSSKWDEVMCDVDETDLQADLRSEFRKCHAV